MKDKVFSALVGAVIGFCIVYGFSYYKSYSTSSSTSSTKRGTFDVKNMSDAQLEKMATRLGITKEELKKKIDTGEDIRSLMRSTRTGSGATKSGSTTN